MRKRRRIAVVKKCVRCNVKLPHDNKHHVMCQDCWEVEHQGEME